MQSTKPLLKLADIADRVGTTIGQVRHMIDRGQFPKPLKIDGLGLRVPVEDFEAWLAAQRSKVAA